MSQEIPPPVNRDNKDEWAEQTVDYLIRKFAEIDTLLNELESRIEVLENP